MIRRALLTSLVASTICLAQSVAPAKPKLGSVAGQVVRTDNSQPIKKAKVALEPNIDEASAANLSQDQALSAYRDRMMESETDETGHFLFTDVLPGKYYLRAEKMGFVDSNARSMGQSIGLPVTVTAGEAAKDLEIKFRPAGAITGRVLNEDGDPMSNVTVQAMRYSYTEGRRRLTTEGQAETNDLGEYRIFNLLPNKYYVRATVRNSEAYAMAAKRQPNRPLQSYWPTFFPDAKSAATATRLDVKPNDEQRANFNLAPAQAFIVSGRVIGIPPAPAHAMPMGTAMLISRDGDTEAGTMMISATDPIFSIGPVPPGDYQLIVFSAEIWPGTTREDIQNVRTGHQPVKVVSSDVANVTVSLEAKPPVQLAGKVRLDPVPPNAVDLRELYLTFDPSDEDTELESGFARMDAMAGMRPGLENGQIAADGTFKAKFAVSNGVVHAHLNARGNGRGFEDYYTKSVLLGGRDVTESGIFPGSLTPGATLELIVSPYGGRVDGTVLDSNKKPVVGAFVACVPSAPKLHSRHELFVTDTTNQHGHYALRGLRPGSYKLYAFDEIDPGAIYSSEFLKPFEDMGESLTIQEKDATTKNLLVLHQTED